MTRQTWTAIVAAALFIVSAAVLAFAPTPFVAWTPGTTYDVLGTTNGSPVIDVQGVATYPTSGELRLTTVAQTRADSTLSFPEALLAYVLPSRDVLPRWAVYPAGRSPQQVQEEEKQLMGDSQSNATVAALRAAGKPVRELPMIQSVRLSGPANDKLEPGDFVVSIDNVAVTSTEDVLARIRDKGVGQKLVVGYLRNGQALSTTIDTVGSNNDGKVATIGVTWTTGFSYAGRVSYGVDPNIGGGSGGLVFAIAIYDRITPGDLLDGRHVAGTGGINAAGEVQSIGGIQEKISGAEAKGSTIFLVPAGNCADTVGMSTKVTLVKVNTLSGAITALEQLNDPAREGQVERC